MSRVDSMASIINAVHQTRALDCPHMCKAAEISQKLMSCPLQNTANCFVDNSCRKSCSSLALV